MAAVGVSIASTVRAETATFSALRGQLWNESPRGALREARADLSQWTKRLVPAARRTVNQRRERLHGEARRLDALSPLSILARGYAIPRLGVGGPVIRSADDVKPGDTLVVRLDREDQVEARVTSTVRGKRTGR